ncbi:MAG: hypothetical protein KDA61_11225 [Planctomycetales bacterium]|nr:hypothetical protein [Planctomycetales bacterium]
MNENIWSQLLYLPPPFNMIVLIIAIVSGAQAVAAVAREVRRAVERRAELDFQSELLDRGMSIEEIQRLVDSRRCAPDSRFHDGV